MAGQDRTDLLEIIDGRAIRRVTIITSQLIIEYWHERIGGANVADAMTCQDRLNTRSGPCKRSPK